ncbi:MAG: DUF5674 family protein [Candidatus Gribaldobacteria bacterium]|nr:DUF5674 family protein [Candidatus Gribaldobacteria bacterium]
MSIYILDKKINREDLAKIAKETFDSLVKGVADVEKEKIAIGGEWHSECQEVLVEQGSDGRNVWGFNIHLDQPRESWLEFFSLINIKPSLGSKDMEIQDENIRQAVKTIVDKFIE